MEESEFTGFLRTLEHACAGSVYQGLLSHPPNRPGFTDELSLIKELIAGLEHA
jgi:hypothetical protein